MGIKGNWGRFKGIFVRRMFEVKKNHLQRCYINTVNAPFVHLAFSLTRGA